MKRGESRRLRTGSPAHRLTAQWVGFLPLDGLPDRRAAESSFARGAFSDIDSAMYPVLFHFGSLLIPSYGVVASSRSAPRAWPRPSSRRVKARSGLETAPRHAWNMLVLAVFASIAVSRLVLIVINLGDLRRHPHGCLRWPWCITPCSPAIGILAAAAAIVVYRSGLSFRF